VFDAGRDPRANSWTASSDVGAGDIATHDGGAGPREGTGAAGEGGNYAPYVRIRNARHRPGSARVTHE